MRGNLPRKSSSSKKRKTKLHSIRLLRSGFCRPHPQQSPEEREFEVDSRTSKRMVSRKDLNKTELETVRISKNPAMMVTGNGEVLAKEEATVCVRELDLFLKVTVLENTPAVLSLGKLCEEFAYSYHWSGQKPHLIKNGKKIHCDTSNYVPFVVPGLSTSSSLSSTSLTVTDTEIPATRRRSGSTDELARGDPLHESAEIENTNKNDDEELQSDELQGLPDWLQEFKHGLVDESVPEHRDASSSCHELPSEPRAKVVPSKHNIFTHFPKDRNRDICLKTKITRASCRRRIGTVVPREENFGDLITADNKVLSKGCESRHNHQYAVVVQDLAAQWIPSYPCKTKTSEETQKSPQEFVEPTRKPKVIYTDNSLEFGKACEELTWKSLYVNTAQIGN